jgi:hypothetical protein
MIYRSCSAVAGCDPLFDEPAELGVEHLVDELLEHGAAGGDELGRYARRSRS